MMNRELIMKKPRFKKKESGYHKSAVEILASWVNGVIEQPFSFDGEILFIPDVTCYKNGILECIYEIVQSHPLTGKKYGKIQEWCFRNYTDLTVFEISADFILRQTEKPERLETIECYTVSLFEYEEIQDELIIPMP
jgi:hypothetical protein